MEQKTIETEGFLSGQRLRSCITGANIYQVSGPLTPLEQRKELPELPEHRTLIQSAFSEPDRTPCVLQPMARCEQPKRWVYDVFERFASFGNLDPRLVKMWDVVTDATRYALVYNPIPEQLFVPFRNCLSSPDTPRETMAIQMFQLLKKLHGTGFGLGGFTREQLWIKRETYDLYLRLDDTLIRADLEPLRERIPDFFLMPMGSLDMLKEKRVSTSAKLRDIFSAAITAFYLLYFSHPYVGSDHYNLTHAEILRRYEIKPVFTFGQESAVREKSFFDFEKLSEERWEMTPEPLRRLFYTLFQQVVVNGNATVPELLDAESWIRALEQDAEKNREIHFEKKYLFDTTEYYRV